MQYKRTNWALWCKLSILFIYPFFNLNHTYYTTGLTLRLLSDTHEFKKTAMWYNYNVQEEGTCDSFVHTSDQLEQEKTIQLNSMLTLKL